MNASQLSRLETNKAQLMGVMRNLTELAIETDEPTNDALLWAASQIRRACERLDEVSK